MTGFILPCPVKSFGKLILPHPIPLTWTILLYHVQRFIPSCETFCPAPFFISTAMIMSYFLSLIPLITPALAVVFDASEWGRGAFFSHSVQDNCVHIMKTMGTKEMRNLMYPLKGIQLRVVIRISVGSSKDAARRRSHHHRGTSKRHTSMFRSV